jgi:predicted metalloenzyme YecM
MAYEAQGRIVEIFDTIQRSDTLRFREFLIETSEEGRDRTYTHILKFQLKNEKIELIDLHKPESVVKVNFNIRSSRWERNGQVSYITNLDAWKIVQITLPADPQASKPTNMPTSEGIDDLPF